MTILNTEEYLAQPLESSPARKDNLREAPVAEMERKIARLERLVAELLAVNQQLRQRLES